MSIKQKFYHELNTAIGSISFKIIASAIDKEKHIERYGKLADDPYEIGLTFLLERTLFELDDLGGVAEIIIESRGDREDKTLAAKYNELITRGSHQVQINRFVAKYGTKIQFRRKRENDCGLQLADLCAYPTSRHLLNPNEPQPAFDIIADKFRRSSRGEVRGYGIKLFP